MVLVSSKDSTVKRSNFYAIISVGLFCIWKTIHFTATKLNMDERQYPTSEIAEIQEKIFDYYLFFVYNRYLFVIKTIPGYLLIVFGCYCLGKLGYDLVTFNDYPHEIQKLEAVRE